MPGDTFLDRLINRLDAMDANSIQAYILRLSKEKGFLETVFNTIREGIIVIDQRLRIRYFNTAAKELLGIPDDKENIRISQFIRDVDWKRVLQQDEDEWHRISRQEIEILYPTHRFLQFYLVPHENSAETATVILNDITQTREQTQNEIESGKIHLISLLAAGVAHEIGNPLNSLYLHLQVLERQLAREQPNLDEMGEILQVTKGEVERLETIISQFLSAIRPTTPNMSQLDIKEIIVDSLNVMRGEIEDRHIDVKCSWPEILPAINADALQMKQAFYNILKNSIQAMPEGGRISIDCSYDEDAVVLKFSDNGKGITADSIGNIFEPYYTSKKSGTGLGLMIVERIIREHGAELAVETDPGKGTSFTITFPRHGRRIRVLPPPMEDIDISPTEPT